MRIRIALALLIFISFGQASAFPSQINNQEQVKGNESAMTATVTNESQTVQATANETQPIVQEPSPQPQTVLNTETESVPPPQPIQCGDNEYANYIYMHESSCRLDAVNSIGCRGLGQACPGTKLPCGNDYECQNKWFTNYAIQRYGSWEQAYIFWLNNHWW